jgi:glycosyltransferase involved in cell wall biosynthesis
VLILIYCPTSAGGIPEHANYQARALSQGSKEVSGEKIVMLCDEMFLLGRKVDYEKALVFGSRFSLFGLFAARFGALVDKSLKIIADQWRLAWEVIMRRPDVVLLASYSEYLAPLWVLPHWILARCFGVVYVANLHDPVRDYVVGPKWWHELSVAMAYWPISVGVVHQRLPEPSPVPKHVQVVEAPVGVYDLQESPEDPVAIRAGWGVRGYDSVKLKATLTTDCTHRHNQAPGQVRGRLPQGSPEGETSGNERIKWGTTNHTNLHEEGEAGPCLEKPSGAAFSNPSTSELARDSETTSLIRSADATASSPATGYSPPATPASPEVVFLAFGFIRDNKNLDLVIRGMLDNPEALLVVMGKAQSQKDKPVDFYRNLALELGVGDRVRFFDEFVPDEKLASYFAAADVVLLTYDKTFHSQSGVLNVAARARRPVLASAGESPLKDCVQRFRLGVFVEPDDLNALKIGMKLAASAESQEVSDSPDWEGYEAFASWDENVQKILDAVKEIRCV